VEWGGNGIGFPGRGIGFCVWKVLELRWLRGGAYFVLQAGVFGCRKGVSDNQSNPIMNANAIERHLDGRESRRLKTEDRLLARQERLERLAAPMIGELMVDGRLMYYVWRPAMRKPYQNASHTAVVVYLVRNGYIR
jgi:hypothetical protein